MVITDYKNEFLSNGALAKEIQPGRIIFAVYEDGGVKDFHLYTGLLKSVNSTLRVTLSPALISEYGYIERTDEHCIDYSLNDYCAGVMLDMNLFLNVARKMGKDIFNIKAGQLTGGPEFREQTFEKRLIIVNEKMEKLEEYLSQVPEFINFINTSKK